MGEAKRRALLDPDFEKVSEEARKFNNFVNELENDTTKQELFTAIKTLLFALPGTKPKNIDVEAEIVFKDFVSLMRKVGKNIDKKDSNQWPVDHSQYHLVALTIMANFFAAVVQES